MKTLVIGLPASGLTSKVCIPAIAKSKVPTIYFGRKLNDEAINFLTQSGKKTIEVPSAAVLREYEQHDVKDINVYCIYNKLVYAKDSKPNISDYINLIKNKYLVVIDELNLFEFNSISELLKISELIITVHSLRCNEKLKMLISKFSKIYLLSPIIPDDWENLHRLDNVYKGNQLVPYYLNQNQEINNE